MKKSCSKKARVQIRKKLKPLHTCRLYPVLSSIFQSTPGHLLLHHCRQVKKKSFWLVNYFSQTLIQKITQSSFTLTRTMQPQLILRECTVGTATSRNVVAARVAHPIKANQLEQSDIKANQSHSWSRPLLTNRASCGGSPWARAAGNKVSSPGAAPRCRSARCICIPDSVPEV